MATRVEPSDFDSYQISHLTEDEIRITVFGSSHKGRRVNFYKLVGDQPVRVTKAEWKERARTKDLIFEDQLIGSHVTTHLKSAVFPRKNRKLTHFSVYRFSFVSGEGHHRIDVKTLAEAERVHDDFIRLAKKDDERQFAALRRYGDRLLILDEQLRYEEGKVKLKEIEAWMDEHIPGSILLDKRTFGLYALCTDHRAAMHFKLKWL